MSGAFNKEVVRSITHSLGRFLAIAVISALGCGFFAGLLMTSVDMNLSADMYYDGANLSDAYVTGTLGLDDEEIDVIAQVEGVKAVAPVRMGDAYVTHGGSKYVMRFSSLDLDAARASDTSDGVRAISDDDSYISRPVLVDGSWPDAPGECVIAADAVLDQPVQVGDVIEIIDFAGEDDETFACGDYRVTGLVRSPYYVMTSNFGSTDLGSGEIESYVYISSDDFAADYPYTGAFVTIDGAAEELYPSDAYDSVVDAVLARLEGLSERLSAQRLRAVQADAQAELDDARAEYESERASAMAQLDTAASKLDDAKAQLDSAQKRLRSSEADIDAGQAQLDDGRAQIEANRAQLASEQQRLDAGHAEYDANLAAFEQRRDDVLAQLDAQQAQVDAIPDEQQRAQAQAVLDAQRAAVTAQLDEARAGLDAAKAELDAGSARLAEGKGQLDQAERLSNESAAALEEGRRQLDAGYASYRQGFADYESGLATYQAERDEALGKLAEAEAELVDAQADIDSIELPEFYVLDRGKNVGVAGYEADASRIDQIARVFPLIFFLVAALVALTTMTRMVDEERMLIGTHKALGYGNARITSKYLVYALVASGIGSVIGVVVLSQALPQIIMRAYGTMYDIPVFASPIDAAITLVALGLSIGITLAATWFAVVASLREKPAALLLPRAPKPGKRILLERMSPLWHRMSFSSKVTARNIFRYKRRFFMAIIGIAGCTALLLTGLGLHDGINDIIEKQFGEIQHFNLEIQSSADQEGADAQRLQDTLDRSSIVTESMAIGSDNVIASNAQGSKDVRAAVIVPEDLSSFEDFYTLRTRVGHEPLSLGDSGAVITEKLSVELSVDVGDVVELYEQSTVGERTGAAHAVKVAGIVEYYTGQRIFMSPAAYEEAMGAPIDFTDVICKADAPLAERTDLSNQMLDIEGVEVVSYYDEIIDTYKTMLQTVNSVVIILIVAAALLAFVVIYNLTNINITERVREIATLKVLGFTPGETNAYIFRETIILTVIGALVGCLLGIWMESFVIVTAEVDQIMFGRDIHLASFVISFVLTLVFSVLISLLMSRKIKGIDMVESLKSVD